MLSRGIDAHGQMGNSKDSEWIQLVLSFLKTLVNDFEEEIFMDETDKAAYVSRLVESAKAASKNTETGAFISVIHANKMVRYNVTRRQMFDTLSTQHYHFES